MLPTCRLAVFNASKVVKKLSKSTPWRLLVLNMCERVCSPDSCTKKREELESCQGSSGISMLGEPRGCYGFCWKCMKMVSFGFWMFLVFGSFGFFGFWALGFEPQGFFQAFGFVAIQSLCYGLVVCSCLSLWQAGRFFQTAQVSCRWTLLVRSLVVSWLPRRTWIKLRFKSETRGALRG